MIHREPWHREANTFLEEYREILRLLAEEPELQPFQRFLERWGEDQFREALLKDISRAYYGASEGDRERLAKLAWGLADERYWPDLPGSTLRHSKQTVEVLYYLEEAWKPSESVLYDNAYQLARGHLLDELRNHPLADMSKLEVSWVQDDGVEYVEGSELVEVRQRIMVTGIDGFAVSNLPPPEQAVGWHVVDRKHKGVFISYSVRMYPGAFVNYYTWDPEEFPDVRMEADPISLSMLRALSDSYFKRVPVSDLVEGLLDDSFPIIGSYSHARYYKHPRLDFTFWKRGPLRESRGWWSMDEYVEVRGVSPEQFDLLDRWRSGW